MKELTEEEVLSMTVEVHNIEDVRYFLKRGKYTSQKTYDNLTRVIAEVGALFVPVRELPRVKRLLTEG